MPGQVDDAVADDRLSRLNALLDAQRFDFNRSVVGRTADVLFEKPGRQSGQAVGKSPWLQAVHVDDAAHLIGQIAAVRIESAGNNSLRGALVTRQAA